MVPPEVEAMEAEAEADTVEDTVEDKAMVEVAAVKGTVAAAAAAAATGALHKAAEATNLAVATVVVAREAMADKKAAKASSNGREPDNLFAPGFCAWSRYYEGCDYLVSLGRGWPLGLDLCLDDEGGSGRGRLHERDM